MNELEQLQQEVRELRELLDMMIKSDRYTIQKDIQLFDGRNIQVAKGTGTKIGTEATQKLGFYGVTPVVQQSLVADPTGGGSAGVDTPARDAIADIIDALVNLGLMSGS